MKIIKVEAVPITVPYDTLIRHAFGARSSGDYVIVKLVTDEGLEGIGSGGVLYPRHSGESQDSAMSNIRFLASQALIGQNPMDIDHIMDRIDAMLYGHWLTKSNIDFALYDLKGKILDTPVYQLLGGLCREKIPLEWIVSLDTPEAMAEMSLKYIKAGFKGLKVKSSGDPKLDVARFKAIREAVGDDVWMGVDMNEAYRSYTALPVIEEMAKYGIDYAEQPVKRNDIDGLLNIRSKTKVPLAVDEGGWSLDELRNVIRHKAADMCHLVPSRIGGLRRALKFRTLAESAGMDYAISCYNGTGLEHAASSHFAVSSIKPDRVPDQPIGVLYLYGGMETAGITNDVCREITGKIENGFLYPPKGPGLGVELNQDIVAEYITKGKQPIVIEE